MVREDFASAFIDVCAAGCHGLWSDAGDLAKLDNGKKGLGPALQRAVAQPYSPADRDRAELDCPRCRIPLDDELAAVVRV